MLKLRIVKQLPIGADAVKALIKARAAIFKSETDDLASQLYTGDISLGQWEETMKKLIRELHTASVAIGKGGWDSITSSDWGKLGTPLKGQYKYLHGFSEYISDNSDKVSLAYIQDRAHKYAGSAAFQTLRIMYGDIIGSLPWLPKDGSTECLTNCKCE